MTGSPKATPSVSYLASPVARVADARARTGPVERSTDWGTRLTSLRLLVPVAVFSIGLTVYNLTVKLPASAEMQIVAAREEAATLAQEIVDASALESIDQRVLDQQLTAAQDYLIPKREDMVGLVTTIEKTCQQHGWKSEFQAKAASEKAAPAGRYLVLFGTLRLLGFHSDDPNASAYNRLLRVLDQIDQLPYKVEVIGLTAMGERDASVASVSIDLQFWIRKPNDKLPAR